MNKCCSILMLVVTLLSNALPGSSARGASQEPFEKLVPNETSFLVAIGQPKLVSEAFVKTSWGELLATEPWQQYRQELKKQQLGCALYLQPIFGLDWNDLIALDRPTLMMGSGASDASLGMLIAIDAQGAEQIAMPLLASYFQSRGARESVYSKDGLTGRLWSIPGQAKTAQEVVGLYHADVMAIFTSRSAADAWLDFLHQQPAKPTFEFAAPTSTQDAAAFPSVRIVIRPAPWIEQALAGRGDNNTTGPDTLASLRRQGVSSVDRIDLEWQMVGSKTLDTQLNLAIKHAIPWTLGMRLMALVPGELPQPPAWLNRDVEHWSTASLDIPTWFEGIGSWFDERTDPDFPGAFEDVIDGLASDPEGPQIRVREEIVARLLSPLMSASWPTDPGGDVDAARQLYAIGARDWDKLVQVMERYFEGDDVVIQGKSGAVRYWHTRDNEPLFMDTGNNSAGGPSALAIFPDRVVVADRWSTLEPLLERFGKTEDSKESLATSQRYAAAKTVLGTLPRPANAGVALTATPSLVSNAYRGLRPAQRDGARVSLSTELLGWLLVGPAWKTHDDVASKLPPLDAQWLSQLGDCVTGLRAGGNTIEGSTFFLLESK